MDVDVAVGTVLGVTPSSPDLKPITSATPKLKGGASRFSLRSLLPPPFVAAVEAADLMVAVVVVELTVEVSAANVVPCCVCGKLFILGGG